MRHHAGEMPAVRQADAGALAPLSQAVQVGVPALRQGAHDAPCEKDADRTGPIDSEVTPVGRIDENTYTPGEITRTLMEDYERTVGKVPATAAA